MSLDSLSDSKNTYHSTRNDSVSHLLLTEVDIADISVHQQFLALSLNSPRSSDVHSAKRTESVQCRRLFMPRTCLLLGLQLLLEKTLGSKQRINFQDLLYMLLHFGNTSKKFRDLITLSVTSLLNGKLIHERMYQSTFLKRFLTRGSVLIDNGSGSSSAFVCDYGNPETVVVFAVDKASELILCNCNRDTYLSTIQLCKHNNLQHLEVSPKDSGDFLNFSHLFSNLLSLKIEGPRSVTRIILSVYVQELTKLQTLIVSANNSKISIIGLPDLACLTVLHLSYLDSCDALNPLVKLRQADFNGINSPLLELLLHNRDNYQCCKLSLNILMIPDSISWVANNILTGFTMCFSRSELHFSTFQVPLVQELMVYDSSMSLTTLEFDTTNRLQSLHFFLMPHSQCHLKILTPLYLLSLHVSSLNLQDLHVLLQNCDYLRVMYLSRIDSDLNPHSATICLNYLESLQLNDVKGVFRCFSALPRLTYMRLYGVPDFSFDAVSVKFPLLKQLSLEMCNITGSVQSNYSLRSLEIKNCQVNCASELFLYFYKLTTLGIYILKPVTDFELLIPSFVKVIRYTGVTLNSHITTHRDNPNLRTIIHAHTSSLKKTN
ncbi:hypothetical protein RCL1_007143 [Eukaryota sp. TZLM3-RCL]